MIAADLLALSERNARLSRIVRWVVGALLVIAVLFVAGFCAGDTHRQHAYARAQVRQLEAQKAPIVAAIAATEHQITIAHAAAEHADTAAAAARQTYSDARQHVAITNDTALSVDGAPPITEPPKVIALIRSADSVVAKDTIAVRAHAADLEAMTKDRDLWRDRALIDEDELALVPELHEPRCGRKCGIVIGATAVVAATHPAVVLKAVAWLVSRF